MDAWAGISAAGDGLDLGVCDRPSIEAEWIYLSTYDSMRANRMPEADHDMVFIDKSLG